VQKEIVLYPIQIEWKILYFNSSLALRCFEWVNSIHLLNIKVKYLKFRNICCWKSYSCL